MSDIKTTDVLSCPRCGKTHMMIAVKPLFDHPRYTHFAMCPNTDEPIMLRPIPSKS